MTRALPRLRLATCFTATNGAVDLPLADVALREVVSERLGVPVFVDNDANVAALAEAHAAELELGTRNVVMFGIAYATVLAACDIGERLDPELVEETPHCLERDCGAWCRGRQRIRF